MGCRRVQPASSKPAAAAGTPRIAAISPALAITLRDLGLAGSIVGRHAWDMALDLSVPMVLDSGRIRAELGYAEPTSPQEAIARTLADEIRRA